MKNVNQYDQQTNASAAYNVSDKINNYVTVASTAQTVTIPTGANVAVFNSTVPFYVNFAGATAAVPAANITDGTGVSYSPSSRYVGGLSTFSIISAQVGVITIEFYTNN